MKKNYQELVMTFCLFFKEDVLTLSGESGPDGFVIDRVWIGGEKE